MKRKELITKTFIMISNLKNQLVSMGNIIYFSALGIITHITLRALYIKMSNTIMSNQLDTARPIGVKGFICHSNK